MHDHSHESHSEEPVVATCCHVPSKKSVWWNIDWLLWSALTIVVVAIAARLYGGQFIATLPYVSTLVLAITNYAAKVWWGILAGMVFVGLLDVIPREFVLALLGRRHGWRGVLRAAGLGILLDLCSHGILLVGAKLYERGATLGQMMAFLIASPWNSLSLTIILFALIGWKLTLAFVVFSFVIAIISGVLFDVFVTRGVLPSNPNRNELPADFAFWREARRNFATVRFDFSFFRRFVMGCLTGSQMVVRWLLLGVILAGLVQTFIPTEHFAMWFGPTAWGLAVTLLAATVIEICSEGSTPLAAELVTRAAAPGNAFAFLMGGVSTDYTEIVVLRQVTGSWKIAFFLPIVTLPQVILLSWVLNNYSL